MNFDSKPTLENTATFWLDDKKKSGIEFYGPDTRQWQTAQIIIGRAEAQIHHIDVKHSDSDIQIAAEEAIRREAYRKALSVAFSGSKGVKLNNTEVTAEDAPELFKAFSGNQLISAINFLFEQESFLGKP